VGFPADATVGRTVAFHTAIGDDRVAAVATRAPVTDDLGMDERREVVAEEGVFEYDSGHTIDERLFEDLATYDFADVTDTLDVPVAIFHGRDDGKVPIDGSLDAIAALDVDTLLGAFDGEGHLFSEPAEDRLQDQLFTWLAAVHRRTPS